MINEKQARRYCREDISHIKNYAEAIADKTRTWICHHINGEPFTGFCKEDLIKMNMYDNRPASELVFVTRKMHDKLHGTCKKLHVSNKGKRRSDETKKKMSESLKGRTLSEDTRNRMSESRKGKHCSDDTRKKISESRKGHHRSDETKKKMSESSKCKHWYNNGIVNTFAQSCPEGFVRGMLRGKTLSV